MSVSKDFPENFFTRYDESDDTLFYTYPRLTVHIDDAAIKALGKLFHEHIAPHSVVLDLMSSYRTHLPADLPVERVVGLGLNTEEMQHNPQLDDFVIHDLNQEPRLPFEGASFDAVLCTVSVQYLVRPVEVFAEVARVLRPGAPFIVSFSNRCFPSKAVRIWMSTSDKQHFQLVEMYFAHAGGFEHVKSFDRSPRRWLSDPLYAVIGKRVV